MKCLILLRYRWCLVFEECSPVPLFLFLQLHHRLIASHFPWALLRDDVTGQLKLCTVMPVIHVPTEIQIHEKFTKNIYKSPYINAHVICYPVKLRKYRSFLAWNVNINKWLNKQMLYNHVTCKRQCLSRNHTSASLDWWALCRPWPSRSSGTIWSVGENYTANTLLLTYEQ